MVHGRWNLALVLRAGMMLWMCAVCLDGQRVQGQGMPGGMSTAPVPDDGTWTTPRQEFYERLMEMGGPQYRPAGTNQLVVDVRISGNETVPEERIRPHLKTRKDREFDPELVQADVRRLVSVGMFQNVRTYKQTVPEGVVVTFEVFERPTIRYVKYVGNRGLTNRALAKQSGLAEGAALNAYAVEEARRKLEEHYHSKGFPNASVSILEGDQPGDQGVVLVISEGRVERIGSVRFVGNTIASDSRLKTQIQSKPGILWYFFGGKVDRAKIDEDLERLTAYYRNLGYFRARIGRELEFDESDQWLTLTFVIDEGPRYVIRDVSVVGSEKFSSEELLERLELQSGEYFNLTMMHKDVSVLRDLYGGQGHIFVDVKADPRFLEEPGALNLVYRIREGEVFRVGRINVHIAGEFPHTRESVILNRLSLRPGDIIDIREVRASERRLKASQLFEHNPAQGVSPRIEIRPPELQEDAGAVAAPKRRGQSPERQVRGQSPERQVRGQSPERQVRRQSPERQLRRLPPIETGQADVAPPSSGSARKTPMAW